MVLVPMLVLRTQGRREGWGRRTSASAGIAEPGGGGVWMTPERGCGRSGVRGSVGRAGLP